MVGRNADLQDAISSLEAEVSSLGGTVCDLTEKIDGLMRRLHDVSEALDINTTMSEELLEELQDE